VCTELGTEAVVRCHLGISIDPAPSSFSCWILCHS